MVVSQKVVMEGWWSVVTADRSSGGSEEGSCAAAGQGFLDWVISLFFCC